MTSAYLSTLEAWKIQRLKNLLAPDGWLNIIGRFWLEAGTVSVGSAPQNDIVLATGPANLGTLTQAPDGAVAFTPHEPGPTIHITPDEEHPPKFRVAQMLMEITTLNGQNALRVRDTLSPEPAAFPGLSSFPPDPEWRIVADWITLENVRGLRMNTTKSIPTDVRITHKAAFTRAGQRYELIATHGTPEAPQFVIRDETSKETTYPASRFVFGEDVTETTIVLDFNKAINPPCAFTEHAVCPLPPAENILPFRIEAGEKRL